MGSYVRYLIIVILLFVSVAEARPTRFVQKFYAVTQVAFSPLDLSGLVLWVDASDSSTITIATGVSQWDDKSGNSNHLTQSSGSLQPTYVTDTSVNVDGTDKRMEIPAGVALTIEKDIYYVFRPLASTSTYRITFTSNAGFLTLLEVGNNNLGVFAGGGFRDSGLDISPSVKKQTQTRIASNRDVSFSIDSGALTGVTYTLGSDAETQPVMLGNFVVGGFNAGDFFEVLIYNRNLTADERAQVLAYLATHNGVS